MAERAGVSMQTVSNYLNNRHRPRKDTRESIERAIYDLKYRPNASARSLRSQRAHSIVLALEDPSHLGLHDPLHLEFLHGATGAARASGYTAVVDVTAPGEAASSALRLVREGRVDGAILSVGELDAGHRRDIAAITRLSAPVVLLQQDPVLPRVQTVSANDQRGAFEAVRQLVALGHRRFVWLGADPEWPGPRHRREGVRLACSSAEVSLVEWEASAYTVADARLAVAGLLSEAAAPTAVIAANDLIALGVVQQAEADGLRVPSDVSVVGFNDFDFASWVRPSITTVRLPGARMAARAFDLVKESLDDPSRPAEAVSFEVELVLRDTTAGVRS
ncbi:LacI family DNA-binding transcriptional regulator [Tenggerimyces flavus]|uniref:LacI family DNA-binding transcriptional regulator n=1 Tax=Tenggerimyces flavus TaxID=1708749 RepID=A0ABV7YQ40_9ACTN|nr:LacI family DNA-binding transcriptional regulator [Tenggerimyces flavus]MBM7786187.1 LacI family transcriptional regulator [Tenggerimyces flavus]